MSSISYLSPDQDLQIRLAAFNWLTEQTDIHGDVLDWTLLKQGFELAGERVHVVSPQGIFTPAQMLLPLSIRTATEGPYDDSFVHGRFLEYRYPGEDPRHRDSVGLRQLMEQSRPLIYFFGLVPSRYLAAWPVYIVGDHPGRLTFDWWWMHWVGPVGPRQAFLRPFDQNGGLKTE